MRDSFSSRPAPMFRADPSEGPVAGTGSYGASTGAGAAAALENVPTYRLYDTTAIGIAAFFGAPIAGTALMAINYRRLGRHKDAVAIFLAGLLVTVAVCVLAAVFSLPQWVTGAIPILLFTVIYQLGKNLQGPIIARHINQGGELSSRWAAFGLSVVCCIALVAAIFSGALAYLIGSTAVHNARTLVMIGQHDNIFISGTATKQDALKLGDALKESGYFKDRGISALLDKSGSGTSVSFTVQDGTWNQPDMVAAFEEIGREVAPSVGGMPIKVRLVDAARDVKKEMNVGKVVVGTKDEVFYLGSATAADGNALAQTLKADGFFTDRGSDVFLAKNDDGTTLTFLVEPSIAANPFYVTQFETLVRQLAPSVGGLPVRLKLADKQLDAEKVEMVN
jgi:hypothetical protein